MRKEYDLSRRDERETFYKGVKEGNVKNDTTGFANSVASPAIEFKTEGWIYGMAAKMFTVAGPIIVFGVFSGVLVGLIYTFI